MAKSSYKTAHLTPTDKELESMTPEQRESYNLAFALALAEGKTYDFTKTDTQKDNTNQCSMCV